MKILITGGGCREAIDGVRCVTNMSTGKTSAALADYFASRGHDVTEIIGSAAIAPQNSSVRLLPYTSGQDLSDALQSELTTSPYDAVIHASAVSDFIPDTVLVDGVSYQAGGEIGKLHSGSSMTVTFRPAPKILDSLFSWASEAGSKPLIFSFKLTNGSDQDQRLAAVKKIFDRHAASFVVSNDLKEISQGGAVHPFVIFAPSSPSDTNPIPAASGQNTREMARAMEKLIKTYGDKK